MADMEDHKHDFPHYGKCAQMFVNDKSSWYMFDRMGAMMGPCPDQDKMTAKEIGRKTRDMNARRVVNAKMVEDFESMGGVLDLTMARIEHLMNFLVTQGIITELQHVTEQLEWEEHLRPQVQAAVEGKREEVEQAKKLAREAQARADARGKLVLPPSARRAGKSGR